MQERRGHSNGEPEVVADGDYWSALRELLEPDAFLDRLVSELLVLVPHAEGALVGLVGERGLIHFVHAAGALHDLIGATLDPAHSLSGLAMHTGSVLRCDDADTDPRVDVEVLRRMEMTSLVSVPLQRDGVPVGVVDMVARRARAFTDADVRRCTALAEVLAAMICSSAEIARVLDSLAASESGAPAELADDATSTTVARFVSNVLSPSTTELVEVRRRVRSAIDEHRFAVVFQPIVRLTDQRLVAVEALSRFSGPPEEPPDRWFAAAGAVGLGVELELAAFGAALEALPDLPGDVSLGVNLGPEALAVPELTGLLEAVDARRVIVELTEHAAVQDYECLQGVLSSLRHMGTRLSVDDTGSGFASLTHIVKLGPEFIKLDRWIIAGLDDDPVRRALVVALVGFAHELGARVVGEGIETASELEVLCALGVDFGQGYYLARPGPLGAVLPTEATAQTA